MRKPILLFVFLINSVLAADKMTAPQLIELAKSNRAALPQAIAATFDTKELKAGAAWIGRASDFFFATEAPAKPLLFIDNAPGPEMQHLNGFDTWFAAAQIPKPASCTRFITS